MFAQTSPSTSSNCHSVRVAAVQRGTVQKDRAQGLNAQKLSTLQPRKRGTLLPAHTHKHTHLIEIADRPRPIPDCDCPDCLEPLGRVHPGQGGAAIRQHEAAADSRHAPAVAQRRAERPDLRTTCCVYTTKHPCVSQCMPAAAAVVWIAAQHSLSAGPCLV
jgi:hypothetical protein